MLNVIWVLENIKGHKSFYNELDTLLLISSALLWEKYNKGTKKILYCDSLTKKYLDDITTIHTAAGRVITKTQIWDEIHILPTNKHIDKSIFWASSKLEVLRNVNNNTVVLDHDFLVYSNFTKHLNSTPVFCFEEDGSNYYPTRYDPLIRSLDHLISTSSTSAINCCFNYFPNKIISNEYARLSLDIMQELTNSKKHLTSKYLIYAEQLALKYFLDQNKVEFNTLLKGVHNSKKDTWLKTNNGIFELDEADLHFRHYWKDKKKIKNNQDGFDYKEEITILYNILKGSKCSISLTSDNS